jgi:hypothetical protein
MEIQFFPVDQSLALLYSANSCGYQVSLHQTLLQSTSESELWPLRFATSSRSWLMFLPLV